MSEKITIWTDGACSGNPGPGGWGAVMTFGGHRKELAGGEAATTNNRMELTAAIRALEALKRPCTVDLYTDSAYLRGGIMTWLAGWKKNGWRTADKSRSRISNSGRNSNRPPRRIRSYGTGSKAMPATR